MFISRNALLAAISGAKGVSCQIVPTILGVLLQDKDAEKARRVMEAMLKMVKIDIAGLKQAYEHG